MEMPASFAASLKVRQLRVTGQLGVNPGSTFDDPTGNVIESPNSLLAVNSLRGF